MFAWIFMVPKASGCLIVCVACARVCAFICVSELGYFWVKVSPGFIIVWPGKAVRDLEACQGHAIVKALSILIGTANVENRKASSDELLPGMLHAERI